MIKDLCWAALLCWVSWYTSGFGFYRVAAIPAVAAIVIILYTTWGQISGGREDTRESIEEDADHR